MGDISSYAIIKDQQLQEMTTLNVIGRRQSKCDTPRTWSSKGTLRHNFDTMYEECALKELHTLSSTHHNSMCPMNNPKFVINPFGLIVLTWQSTRNVLIYIRASSSSFLICPAYKNTDPCKSLTFKILASYTKNNECHFSVACLQLFTQGLTN